MKRFYFPFIAALASFLTTSTRFVTSDVSVTNAAAWRLIHNGSIAVPHSWINKATANEYHLIHGQCIPDRMPGMILSLAPFQWVGGPKPTILGFMALAFVATFLTVYLVQQLWGNAASVVACIGTPLLSVNKELWPQTLLVPAMLLGLYAINRWQYVWTVAPLMFYATITRPPFAVCLLGVFAFAAYLRPRLVAWGLLGTATGVAFLLLWTHHYFGFWSLAGGYAIDGHKRVSFLTSLYVGFLSPQRGIFFYSPWVIVAFKRFRLTLVWVLLYTVAEWYEYNAFGGDGFFGYRYPLPLVILAIPFFVEQFSYVRLALLSWSVGISEWVFIHDKLQYVNVGRNPNLMPVELAYWGASCLTVSCVVMVILHVQSTKLRKRESLNGLLD